MYQYIQTTNTNGTLIITINREQVYNALNRDSKFEIVRAIRSAQKDSEVKSIILTAKGRAFCSGQDLNDRTVNDPNTKVDIGRTIEEEWNPLISAIRNSEKLVIAAINGVCAGAGLSMALACDIKISPPQNKFICGFTQIGLAPDAGLSSMLSKSMGYSKALEFALLGKPLFSEDLINFNLINHIDPAPLERALTICEQINALAPLAVKMIKKNFKLAVDASFEKVIEQEKYAQRFLGFSEDYREGVSAFLEKRKPSFKGK